jgi:hypothetical protein
MVTTRHRKKEKDEKEANERKEGKKKTKIGSSKQQKRKFDDVDENELKLTKMKEDGPRKLPPTNLGKEEKEEEGDSDAKTEQVKAQKKKYDESKFVGVARKKRAFDKRLSRKTTEDGGRSKPLPVAIRELIDVRLGAGHAEDADAETEEPKAQKKKSDESKLSAVAKKKKALDKGLSRKTTKDGGPTKPPPPAIHESTDYGLGAGYADMDFGNGDDPVVVCRPKQPRPKLPTRGGDSIRVPRAGRSAGSMYTDYHRKAQQKFQKKAREYQRLVSTFEVHF